MQRQTLSLLSVGLLTLALFGCEAADNRADKAADSRADKATGNRDKIPDNVLLASHIVSERLRSPSSFSLVSWREMWAGTDSKGNPAYLVRVEYDAQNGFGAMIRDCKVVAFFRKGDKVGWNNSLALGTCHVDETIFPEQRLIQSMRAINFED